MTAGVVAAETPLVTPGSIWARHRLAITVGGVATAALCMIGIAVAHDAGRQGPREEHEAERRG